jgi:GNAT superfamily N-acetyltransferase
MDEQTLEITDNNARPGLKSSLVSLQIELKPLTPQDVAAIDALQRDIYPPEMWEDAEILVDNIMEYRFNIGVFVNRNLAGFIMAENNEDATEIYLTDIAVHPRYQRQKLGSLLIQELFKKAISLKARVSMHCRISSYAIFSSTERMQKLGYRIVLDEFQPDWYFQEFGIHEDAHYLVVEPLPSIQPVPGVTITNTLAV